MTINKRIQMPIDLDGSEFDHDGLAILISLCQHYQESSKNPTFLSEVFSELQNHVTKEEFWKQAISSMSLDDQDMVIKMIVGVNP